MKIKNIKISYRQASFELIFIIWLVLMILKTSLFSNYILESRYIFLISYALLFVREIYFGKYSKRDFLVISLIFFASVVITLSGNQQGTNPLIAILLFSFCARDIDVNRVIKISTDITLIMLLLIILSSHYGIIIDYLDRQIDGRVRHYLGFLYALYPASYMLEILLANLYLKRNKIFIALLAILDLYIYIMTKSRLSFYLSIIAIILCSFRFVQSIIKTKVIKFFTINIFTIFAIVSAFLTLSYNESNEWMMLLDVALNYRLVLGKRAFSIYGLSALGSQVNFTGSSINAKGEKYGFSFYLTVDNGYLDMLIKYGYITLIILLLFITIAMIHFYNSKNYEICIVYSIISLYLCIDFSMFNLVYNVFLLALFKKNLYCICPIEKEKNKNKRQHYYEK